MRRGRGAVRDGGARTETESGVEDLCLWLQRQREEPQAREHGSFQKPGKEGSGRKAALPTA